MKVTLSRQSNTQILQRQREDIIKNIKGVKEKIIDHLNMLENKLLADLQITEERQILKMVFIVSKMQENVNNIKCYQQDVQSVKKFGSDL